MVERVLGGRALEDDRVELKAQWPSTSNRKVARQIAGHANAARGDDILWLIGVDEERRCLVDAGAVEMADWWPQVARRFDELTPDHTYLAVPVAGGVVHAIVFSTSRAPFVVTADGGGVEREVPWRSGNSTRSARRSEILRSLVDEVSVPTVSCFSGEVIFSWDVDPDGKPKAQQQDAMVRGEFRLYVEALGPCMWPQHLWEISLNVGGHVIDLAKHARMEGPTAGPTSNVPRIIERHAPADRWPAGMIEAVPSSGLHVHGSDAVTMHLVHHDPDVPEMARWLSRRQKVTLAVKFPLANSSRAARLSIDMFRMSANSGMYDRYWPKRDDVRRIGFAIKT